MARVIRAFCIAQCSLFLYLSYFLDSIGEGDTRFDGEYFKLLELGQFSNTRMCLGTIQGWFEGALLRKVGDKLLEVEITLSRFDLFLSSNAICITFNLLWSLVDGQYFEICLSSVGRTGVEIELFAVLPSLRKFRADESCSIFISSVRFLMLLGGGEVFEDILVC